VAVETAFARLTRGLEALRDALEELGVATEEYRPLEGDAALVDVLTDAALVSRGWIEEALQAARTGERNAARRDELARARRALVLGQERYSRVAQRLFSDLLSYDRVDMVARLGRERGGAWAAWAKGVREALDRLRQPLFEVDQALFACSQALAERSVPKITVQAIGQQFYGAAVESSTPPGAGAADAGRPASGRGGER
jgi:hypothetical protein